MSCPSVWNELKSSHVDIIHCCQVGLFFRSSASQKILGREKFAKKTQRFSLRAICSRLQISRNFKKRFIGHFSRCSLQPASCIKTVVWTVENNYVQDHVPFFFVNTLPFAKQGQFITLLCCSLACLVVMKNLSQVGLLLIFELRTEIWN